MSGKCQAAEPLAMYASVNNTHRSHVFQRNLASHIGRIEAIGGRCSGDNPASGFHRFFRTITCNRSVCSDLVGRPVDGPPRCTSTMTNGNSVITAKFIASLFRQMPGPEVVVTASAPANDAPTAEAHPAISSSHCTVFTPSDLCLANSCRISVAGVMGYEPR